MKRFFLFMGLGLVFSVCWYFFWGEVDYRIRPVLSDKEFEKAIELGEPIIANIEKYYADKGSYPRRIQDLIPEYIIEEKIIDEGLQKFYFIPLKAWVEGQETDKYFLLFVTERGIKMIGKRELIAYNPNHNYPDLKHTKTIKVYKGWAQRIQYPVPKEEAEMLQYWHDNPPGNIFENQIGKADNK